MSAEIFIYRDDASPKVTVDQLKSELARAGAKCRIEQHDDGPWLALDGSQIDMSVTVDLDGTATSVMVQCNDNDIDAGDALLTAFTMIGWIVEDGDEF